VLGAGSGGEALRQLAGSPEIDLIVAGLAMPDMNGVDLARTVRGCALAAVDIDDWE
jgi:CheY-like chemotaxis protein